MGAVFSRRLALAGLVTTGAGWPAPQFGLSLLVWGVFVRTVLVWHITWSVNSVTHLWGYRNYDTDENSRNNWLVALVTNGEGWHNNHHADPRSAAATATAGGNSTSPRPPPQAPPRPTPPLPVPRGVNTGG